MTNMAVAVGVIGFIFIACIVVAAFSPVMGSLHNDAVANGVANGSRNMTYNTGVQVAQGFIGFDMAIVAIAVIVLIVIVLLLMFAL